jgi:hypothetical protein
MAQSAELRREALLALTEFFSASGLTMKWLEQLEQACAVEGVELNPEDPDYAATLAHRAREVTRLREAFDARFDAVLADAGLPAHRA